MIHRRICGNSGLGYDFRMLPIDTKSKTLRRLFVDGVQP